MSQSPPRRTLTLKKAPRTQAEEAPQPKRAETAKKLPAPKGRPAPRPNSPAARPAIGKTGDDPWAKWRTAPSQGGNTPPVRPSTPTATPAQEGVRLSKVMAERGLCSRREADLWIERGWVFVEGECITALGTRIAPEANIAISKEAVRDQARQVTILLHKPVGYVSGQPEPGCIPAVSLIRADNQIRHTGDQEFSPWMLRGLAPAGRLDIDSTGLLVLTQNGRIARQLIGEDSQTEKEYLVRVSGQMIPNGLELLNFGLSLDGKPLKQARVKQLNPDQLHFILREGKKRQIRRMCEQVGLHVTGLKRVRIGKVCLADLPQGQWRLLHPGESF